jgi:AraC-like DNA-binding protein
MNHHYQGFLYYLQEQFEQVFPCLEKSLQLKPDLPFPPLYWGESLLLTGKVAAGLAYFQQLPLDVAGDLTSLGGSTLAYAEMGKVAEAEAGLAQLRAALQTDARGSAMNFLIMCHTRLGQHEAALALIEQGIGEHLPMMLLLGTEPMLKPLRAIPRFQALWRQALGEPTEFDFLPRKYKQSLLDESTLTQHRQALIDLMETDQLYLDPALSLRGLAERLGIPANHLSQLLNEGFQQNFSEFVNTYRLQQFQTMVADPAQRHLTILALAFESGFNSKTVFNTFFKKTMGQTPRAYWKSIVSR